MALALLLGESHTTPKRLTVNAASTLDEVGGAPRITAVELSVCAPVSGLEQTADEQQVARAADLCPASNAPRANVQISLHSELERD